jgi:SPP1 family phage portal protein
MTIKEIMAIDDPAKIIIALKQRQTDTPDSENYIKEFDPLQHKVMDKSIRRDKIVKVDADTEQGTETRIEPVNRISLAMQKIIVNRAVSFLFGNPVRISATPEGDQQDQVFKVMKNILKKNKSTSLNRKIARAVFSMTEAAEYWYPVEKKDAYGIPSKFGLKCTVFSPANGDTLYPLFDEFGDMIAFSREYILKDGNKTFNIFETYTDENMFKWISGGTASAGIWELSEGFPKANPLGKIPIIYARQENTEWYSVQSMIERLEIMLSNFADTNDYHSSPTIKVRGKVSGFVRKGEQGKILELEGENSDVSYLSWDRAPESVKLEIETLTNMIYTLSQTPDISFDKLQGNSNVSGIALKLMFMDAHLKVMDKLEIFDEFIERRLNIIKAFIGKVISVGYAKAADSLEVDFEITPYIINSLKDVVDMLIVANGNKPLVSHETSVAMADMTDDPQSEFEAIQSELETTAEQNLANPTMV